MFLGGQLGTLISNLVRSIKRSARENPGTYRLYHRYLHERYTWGHFLAGFPAVDILRPRKLKLVRAVQPYTYMYYPRLSMLYDLATELKRTGVGGQFVECGVANGGSAGLVGYVFRHDARRHVWLFDSWQGLPEPGAIDVDPSGQLGRKGSSLGLEQRARELLLEKLRIPAGTLHFVKGWFEDTIHVHKNAIGPIALLHLDCDWYESVKLCLEQLYEHVTPGGFVVIDDYGYWQGCKKAVDEFIENNHLRVELVRIDDLGVYFRKQTHSVNR
jgi:O-methyltransferase